MLSPDILKQIRRIQLRASHLVTGDLAGNYLSAFKGRGMEFDRVREYVPGDDVRTIDWNVTARTHAPHIKVLREERELNLILMVDVSSSQLFGTTGRQKNELAAEMAAVLAFLATRNNDKVGLLVFSDHVEQFIPPKKGRGHIWKIIRGVLTHTARGQRTDISLAVDDMMRLVDRRAMGFLISDFWAEGYERSLKMAARSHDLVAIRVVDPREEELPAAGLITLCDSETGAPVLLDTSDPRVRQRYEQLAKERRENLYANFRRMGVDAFDVRTTESVVGPLASFLRARERRRNR